MFDDRMDRQDFKISILDTYNEAYKTLALLLLETNRQREALLVCDRGRACILGDTLSSKYNMQKQRWIMGMTQVEELLESDLTDIMSDTSCLLFLATLEDNEHSWVLSRKHPSIYVHNRLDQNNITNPSTPVEAPTQRYSKKHFRELFQKLITPIQEHLTEKEVVIVPEGPLYMVPFAALQDPQTRRYFCETHRLRIVPSLTTLKILKQCPSDYHCTEGALVVGNPYVGEVMFRGEKKTFSSLEAAEIEAQVFGSILGISPLTGTFATKDSVKEKLKEGAVVIHIAAHGDDATGEIVLAPSISAQSKVIPEEEDYILTMQEVQKIGVRAKLVVLSCCHSGCGAIRAEGVMGMARAFLAAGARSVVASLWDINDQATLDFMSGFYMHLRYGESASKSLNESMKELIREETYSHPKYWAPFVLIGDDVTIF